MKRSLMSLVVAGSWVLWASAANAEITMKLSDLCGIPTLATINAEGDAGLGLHYWEVEVWSGGYITDLSEDGTFTTDVPEGTKLSASPTGCKPGQIVKKTVTINEMCGMTVDMGPSSSWTPAKDGGVLIISGENCMGGLGELGDID